MAKSEAELDDLARVHQVEGSMSPLRLDQIDWRRARDPGAARTKQPIHENGLQAHLQVVHGYARTRLTGLETIKLVMRHQWEHRGNPGHD